MAGDWEHDEPESSDSMKTFGAFVQGLREHAGFTREEFGPLVQFSKHTIESIELGRRMPDKDFVERAELALGCTGALRRGFGHLTRQPGLAAWFRKWAKLEQVAVSLCTYECRVLPGLLQSEAYARALFRNQVPPLDDEQVEKQLVARLERQELLSTRPNTAYNFIVEEALLLRQVGGAEVTRGLIDHVLAVCRDLRNVEVQLMPLRRTDHAGSGGPIQLLETPEHRWIAYVEGQRGGWLHSDAKEVSVLQMRYARMRTQALTPEDTVGLLERLRGAL